MKIISFVVPCYNSEEYLENCISTLLSAGEDAEIILINDGSKDRTPEICDHYAARYPEIIRVVHQENGGHGEGVNQGLARAEGLYFKVIDSDDWAEEEALQKVMAILREFSMTKNPIDMLIANYVYDNKSMQKSKTMRYRNVFPVNKVFAWQDIRQFLASQYLLMHSVFYRTEVLRNCRLQLPKHTFYVDNVFVYEPLPFVKTIYYMDEDFYRYTIGREDQSVNEKVMIGKVDHQLRVTMQMIYAYDLQTIKSQSPRLANYMVRYLSMMTVISSIFLILADTAESEKKRKNLWRDIRKYDKKLYAKLRYRSLAVFVNLPGERTGKKLSVFFYKMARKRFRFN